MPTCLLSNGWWTTLIAWYCFQFSLSLSECPVLKETSVFERSLRTSLQSWCTSSHLSSCRCGTPLCNSPPLPTSVNSVTSRLLFNMPFFPTSISSLWCWARLQLACTGRGVTQTFSTEVWCCSLLSFSSVLFEILLAAQLVWDLRFVLDVAYYESWLCAVSSVSQQTRHSRSC